MDYLSARCDLILFSRLRNWHFEVIRILAYWNCSGPAKDLPSTTYIGKKAGTPPRSLIVPYKNYTGQTVHLQGTGVLNTSFRYRNSDWSYGLYPNPNKNFLSFNKS